MTRPVSIHVIMSFDNNVTSVMQSQQDTVTPFQILGGEAQVVQVNKFFFSF